ncbi:ABC transporter transmembrane domain-containing protein [Methylobacterium sp. NEAU K]|uniref:ABC transporter transmembrane domain-containing protein n=1 Tax=Methylobacterium sp. NEAU K TaxID=3064946 RepID=UPI0027360D8B|nr:ABC transporter transmembrane domain-containing protein [Methylobacterium sp. NEAU K]MDP4006546.1 ABC transporter transmembrane domain-containing protein [Methylobacterium sp. NEAU K]
MDAKHTPLTLAEACRLIVRLLKPEAGFVWTAVVYGIAVALLGLATPVSVQLLINSVANTALPAPLFVLSGLLLGLLLAAAMLSAARVYVLALFERRVFARMVADITLRALHARDPHFDDSCRSDLFNRFFDLMTVQKAVPQLLIGGFAILLQSGIGLVLTSFYHPFLLAFNLVVAAVLLGVGLLWAGPALRSGAALSHAKHETARWLQSIGSSNGFYKGGGRFSTALARSETMTAAYVQAYRRHFRHTFAQTIGFLTVYAVASAALLAMGGWLILQGQLSLGQLVAAELVLSGAFYGISQLGSHARTFYDLVAALHELSLFEGIEQTAGDGRTGPSPADGSLRLRDVEADGCRFDFAVARGEVLAVSADDEFERTITALLHRRLRPQRGWVMVGGSDITAFDPDELRSEIVVLDRPTLVETSIRDYLSPIDGQSAAAVHDCLERVGLAERIRRLPSGLDTPLSATGSPLSTGEAIALKLAALLLDPPKLVILSALSDLLPPDRIAASLASLGKAGTTVLHATRHPPLPIHADQIRLGPHGYVRAADHEDRLDQAILLERTHAVAA